jgi:flagella synthesis protein FlgN
MPSAQALRDLMTREQDGLTRLHQLLEAEHAAIAGRDTTALDQLTAEKLTLLAELEGFAKERQAVLQQAGLSADRAGFETLLAGFPGDDGRDLSARWETIQAQLDTCQEQNRLNGIVLDASYRATQQALAILLGQTREAETYDARGSVRPGNTQRQGIKA